MVNRVMSWAILIWTGLMGVGIVAAFLNIGRDCAALSGDLLTTCQNDAWARGSVGLLLLVGLWLLVMIPLGAVWMLSRQSRTPA